MCALLVSETESRWRGPLRRCLQFSFSSFLLPRRRLQAAHPQQHQHLQIVPEHGHWGAERPVQQAVRSLQVVAIPEDEDGVEVQRVPRPLSDSGAAGLPGCGQQGREWPWLRGQTRVLGSTWDLSMRNEEHGAWDLRPWRAPRVCAGERSWAAAGSTALYAPGLWACSSRELFQPLEVRNP